MKLPVWKARNFVINFDASLVQAKAFDKRMREALLNDHFVRYVVYQKEPYSEKGKFHYQVYVETKQGVSASRVLKWLSATNPDKINIDKRKGSRSDARYYCMKDAKGKYSEDFDWPGHRGNSKPAIEYGHWRPDINSQKVAIQRLNAAIDKAESLKELYNDDDVSRIISNKMNYAEKRFKAKPPKEQEGIKLRPWQATLEVEMLGPPDPRKVIWYVDTEGNAGKTFMTRYLVTNHGAVMLDGKKADIKYGYDGEKIAIFDLTRAQDGRFSYGGLENIKNGIYYNTKYTSCMYVRDYDIHTVVFSNWEPDLTQLSKDRWEIRYINDAEEQWESLLTWDIWETEGP